MNLWIRSGVGLLLGVLLLTGCQSADGDNAEKRAKMAKEEKAAKKEEKESLRVAVNEETSKAWRDKKGKVKAIGAAAIRNTGKKAVELDSVQLYFLSKDKKLLAKKEVLAVVPKILKPGETAYVGGVHELTSLKEPDELDRVSVKPHVIPALKSVPEIKLVDIKGDKDRKGKVSVKGTVKNESTKEMKDILLSAVLKDKQGRLLAVLHDYLNVKIPGGKSASFTAEDHTLPKELMKQVDVNQSEVEAYPLVSGKQ
ncbi:hypothetical protein SAMN05444487_1163 [Marininema mesophilum]|uniref:Lipoprotein n=1 Tax=Marininema mesophilum TaxID=1048340 RepID=A0A1H3B7W1_9BACL|nr:hypothetical protein [Marininema mesophilum]SDX38027.1 hypothetical protein SAMN05444487_1163 [Marininema mesophilum]